MLVIAYSVCILTWDASRANSAHDGGCVVFMSSVPSFRTADDIRLVTATISRLLSPRRSFSVLDNVVSIFLRIQLAVPLPWWRRQRCRTDAKSRHCNFSKKHSFAWAWTKVIGYKREYWNNYIQHDTQIRQKKKILKNTYIYIIMTIYLNFKFNIPSLIYF